MRRANHQVPFVLLVGARPASGLKKPILSKRCQKWAIEAQKTGLRTVRTKPGQMVRETVDETRCSSSRATWPGLTVDVGGLFAITTRNLTESGTSATDPSQGEC